MTERMALDGLGEDVNVFLPKLRTFLGGVVLFFFFGSSVHLASYREDL